MINYSSLGLVPPEKKRLKVPPNPKDIKPVKDIVRVLNQHFYRKGNKVFDEVIWYAFMPWVDNPSKKWYFLCSSTPEAYSKKARTFEKAFRSKHPNLQFEFLALYGRMYFQAINMEGTYL